MVKIIKDNSLFFGFYAAFLMIAFFLTTVIDQGDCIRYFSQHRSPQGDFFFKYITMFAEEFMYIFLIIIGLFFRYRYALIIFLIGVSIAFISITTKAFYQHDRPSVYFYFTKELDTLKVVEGVELHTGQSSFPSGHSMSAFAIFGFFALLLGNKRKLLSLTLLLLAILVGVSRIYLIQHFLKDVIAGSIFGIMVAMVFVYIHRSFPFDSNQMIDRSILSRKTKPSPKA